MNKALAVIATSVFVLHTAAAFAADKREELTKDQRMEMRDRADRLVAERAAHPMPANEMQSDHGMKKHRAKTAL